MEPKTCPKCGSRDYTFRSCKKIAANAETGELAVTEMKYRCQTCGEE